MLYLDMNLAENIRKYRKAAGLTQTQLADKLGITQYAITNYERGISNPSAEKIPELAKFLGVLIQDLYGAGSSAPIKIEASQAKNSRDRKMRKIFEELPPTDQRALLKQAQALRIQKANSARKKSRS